jgi:hypothetical protein
MSTEQNKSAKWRYIEAFNRRDLTVFPELFAAGYILRAAGFPEIHGPDELQRAVAVSFETLSDIRLTADDMVAEGDKVPPAYPVVSADPNSLRSRACRIWS